MDEKPIIRISIRNLVEFILRAGDIDNRHMMSGDQAMAEGSRIHRKIQASRGSNYRAEVSLKFQKDCGRYLLGVEGRADGIEENKRDGISEFTIEEIKGTYRELFRIQEPDQTHLAQAKCYAYLYASQYMDTNIASDAEEKENTGTEAGREAGTEIIYANWMNIRMTYCNLDTEEIRIFESKYTFQELQEWFEQLLEEYQKWADFEFEWKEKRQHSIELLSFPFPYRKGQKEFVTYVYQTIYHKRKLFAVAPTGVGKTVSTLFPAVMAVGKGMGDKIFYLTAKTITRTVAEDTYALLREKGLKWKSLTLTAKDKICPYDKPECNPDDCEFAKGHYDRINVALFELLYECDEYRREKIVEIARKHRVCPFELSLDLSLFSDGIICDYNYVFDPHAYLRRFFADGVEGNYLFLVDEAHNLLERGREMYSATLVKEEFLALKKLVKVIYPRLEKHLERCNKELLILKRECQTYQVLESFDSLVHACMRLYTVMEEMLGENEKIQQREEILDLYFKLSHFLSIYERLDDHYVSYSELKEDGTFSVKLFCVDPSSNLAECMGKARSTVLFSATLLPIAYYKKLLGGETKDYEVLIESAFDPNRRALLIGSEVTSKYTRRNEQEYQSIAGYIHEVVKRRHGNYLIFCPSHQFLHRILDCYSRYYMDASIEECIYQSEHMDEKAREDFLNRFADNTTIDLETNICMEIEIEEEQSLLGFCVLGGIFSEGIDLTDDRLIGSIIIGTGLPQVCTERELMKMYFEEAGMNGFDYAYRFPGMNKVLQAAGRVIRTTNDFGVVVLLDERFTMPAYRSLFPKEWENYEVTTKEQIGKKVDHFWNEWL